MTTGPILTMAWPLVLKEMKGKSLKETMRNLPKKCYERWI